MKNRKTIKHKLVEACVFDLDDIFIFEKQVLNDSSEYTSKKNLNRIIKSPKTQILLVKDSKGRICAYGIATLRYYKPIPSGHIYKIAVLPEYRRLGLGSELMKELEIFIYKNKIFKVFAEVRESNEASLGMFQKLGYKRAKNLYGHYSCLDDSYELENGIKLCKVITKTAIK